MNTVSLAQSDPYARNYLLIRNEGFVKKTAVNICNRLRQTNNNEILEIAFSAFNEAIDIFPKTKEGHFLSFTRKVIELRMYEHFERTGKLSSLDMKNTAFKSITPLIEKPKVGDRREKILDLWEKHKDEYSQGLIDGFTFDGKAYGFSYTQEYWPVWYNKEVFDRLGLEEPETWDQFTAICDTLLENGITPIAQTVQARWPTFIWFEEMIIGQDPDLYVDLCEGKVGLI